MSNLRDIWGRILKRKQQSIYSLKYAWTAAASVESVSFGILGFRLRGFAEDRYDCLRCTVCFRMLGQLFFLLAPWIINALTDLAQNLIITHRKQIVVPFCGLCLESYKVLPKRNYNGAYG